MPNLIYGDQHILRARGAPGVSSAKKHGGKYEFIAEQSTSSGHWSRCEWSDDSPLLASERRAGNYRSRKVCPSNCFCCCWCLVGVAARGLRFPSRSTFIGALQGMVHDFI